MTANAVFFGGTDPGRFVPTYMIYSAKVREDIFLITQNALADNTYMSVMRDLYGNRIWIPSHSDSAASFSIYIDDVNSGRRTPNADIKIENGRAQISGAAGVMELNGILARMIFEHNNYRHDFYVEESYVLQWMYPYMEPNGLIMKINRAVLPYISRDRATDDMDFWDWYTRRLSSNNKFLRDIVARKSFSKLRGALAGLYSNCNGRQPGNAEKAFQESILLYPLSPEANFRLADLYMKQNRTADTSRLLSGFGRQDPGNRSITDFLAQVARIENLSTRIKGLEGSMKSKALSIEEGFELSGYYLQLGQSEPAMGILNSILSVSNLPAAYCLTAATFFQRMGRTNEMIMGTDLCRGRLPSNTPPQVYVEIAQLYAQAGQINKMGDILQLYLKMQPDDWKAWLDMAVISAEMKQTNDMTMALENAVKAGGTQAATIISHDPRFQGFKAARK